MAEDQRLPHMVKLKARRRPGGCETGSMFEKWLNLNLDLSLPSSLH